MSAPDFVTFHESVFQQALKEGGISSSSAEGLSGIDLIAFCAEDQDIALLYTGRQFCQQQICHSTVIGFTNGKLSFDAVNNEHMHTSSNSGLVDPVPF